jgi:exodeoxyribonuclease V alpha subunit
MTAQEMISPSFASNRLELEPGLETLFSQLVQSNQIGYEDISTLYDLLDIARSNDTGLAVLLLGLFASLKEGGICLPLDKEQLFPFLYRLLPFPGETGRKFIEQTEETIKQIGAGYFPYLISQSGSTQKPLVFRKDRGQLALYFQKYDFHEKRLREKITGLIQRSHSVRTFSPDRLKAAFQETFVHHPGFFNGEPVRYSDEQKLAVALAAQSPLTLISGGPGTGKTSIVFALLRCLLQLEVKPEQIVLAAPTGRAARRLTESLSQSLRQIDEPLPTDTLLEEIPAKTLHRLLRYSPQAKQFVHNRLNPLPGEVLIVDEISMVDIVMMSILLDGIADNCRVILLGDRHQLPSVEAGAVLADLLPTFATPVFSKSMSENLKTIIDVQISNQEDPSPSTLLQDRFMVLSKNFRSTADILSLAQWINQADTGKIDSLLQQRKVPLKKEPTLWPVLKKQENGQDEFRWLWLEEPEAERTGEYFPRLIRQWAEDFFLRAETGLPESFAELVNSPFSEPLSDQEKQKLESLCNIVDRARILTVLRRGERGCERINELISRYLRKKLEPGLVDGFFNGCPVLVTRNNARLGIYNGDVGLCIRDNKGDRLVVFRLGEEMRFIPLHAVPGPEPAYATTVHKSQGSEFEQVFLVLPRQTTHRLLTREILYTGVTRAKYGLTLLGLKSAIVHAVQTRVSRFSSPALLSSNASGQNRENSE